MARLLNVTQRGWRTPLGRNSRAASYDSMANHLATLTQVKSTSGTAGGRTIYPLRKEQDPKEFMAVSVKPGIYDLKQAVELYRKPDGVGTLTVK